MKYTRGQFTNEYYQLWELGLLLPVSKLASVFSVKYRKNHFDEYSRVTLKAASVADALERACYAITYASPWRPEDIDLHAVYDEEENLLWIDEPFYEVVQKKNEFRGMERREFIAKFVMTTAAILFGLRPLKALAGTSVTLGGTASGFVPTGEQLYTTAGSYNWTVPSGVTSSSLLVIGGGGAGGGGAYSAGGWGGGGGGGGGLGYKNSVTVVPGQTYTIQVGAGGASVASTSSIVGTSGGSSSVTIAGTVYSVTGGNGGAQASAGAYGRSGGAGGVRSGNFEGGGTGGDGGQGSFNTDPNNAGGGGGAGGYSGNGGKGADGKSGNFGQGSGGAAAGGADYGGYGTGGGGGGIGIYGVGVSGTSASASGSSGTSGQVAGTQRNITDYDGGGGGNYGGGGGSMEYDNAGGENLVSGAGGSGAVRIIWGTGRSFPNNAS